MSKHSYFKLFLALFFAFSFLLLPGHKVLAKTEIILDESNPFDNPHPPYRLKQANPPRTFEGTTTPGTPVKITGSVEGCSIGQVADVQAYPVANRKEILNNLTQNNATLKTITDVTNIIFPVTGLVLKLVGLGSNNFSLELPKPAGYYIYAKCGNKDKYENIDTKYVEVYDPNPALPPEAPAGPPVTGERYCPGDEAIDTAIGCVPYKPIPFIRAIFKFSLGIGGGVALLIMALAAISMITSQGNPEALKKANGQFTSAVIGLLFIIFAVLLLQIIGVDLLNIPGFTR